MHISSAIPCILIILALITGSVAAPAGGPGEDLLDTVSRSLLSSLDTVDQNMTTIAREYSETDGEDAPESVVSPGQINQPGWGGVILTTGDRTDTMLNPSVITGPLSSTILEDPAIQDSIRYIRPKMGMVRDISAVDQGVTIVRPAVVKDRIGAAVALIIPWSLGESVIRPVVNGTANLSIVMQSDGTILYTTHPTELTKVPPENFLTEFATFHDIRNAMIQEKEGTMIYELWRAEPGDPRSRNASWKTIDLHGTEWRVMIADAIT